MTLFIASFVGFSVAALLLSLGLILHKQPPKSGCGGAQSGQCCNSSQHQDSGGCKRQVPSQLR